MLSMKVSGCLTLWCNTENTSSYKGSFSPAFSCYQQTKTIRKYKYKNLKSIITNKNNPHHASLIWCKWHRTSRMSANLSSVSISWLFLANFDLLWNSVVDQISLIIWFQSSLFIQIEPLLMQSIIFVVFLSDIALLRARVNYWFKAILVLSSQILQTIGSSSSENIYFFYIYKKKQTKLNIVVN